MDMELCHRGEVAMKRVLIACIVFELALVPEFLWACGLMF